MTRQIRRTIHVRCSVRQAFGAFTEQIDLWWPRHHRRFERSRMSLDARVGGLFLERSEAGDEVRLGQVLACEPPDRILYSWYPGAVDRPTEVEIRFFDEPPSTRVEVVHSEVDSGLGEAWPERAQRFEAGWTLILPAYAEQAAREPADDKTRSTIRPTEP